MLQISLIRWAYEGLCVNEFSGLELIPDKLEGSVVGATIPGEKTLQRMGMTHSVKHTLLAQAGITLANYLFTCIILSLQDPKGKTIDLTKQKANSSNENLSRATKASSGQSESTFQTLGAPSLKRF